MDNPRKNLTQLFVPIALETLCYMLAGIIDTLMLSSVGDSAVGAVGTANTYIGIFIIMFNIVCSGMIAVMTQYIGANQPGMLIRQDSSVCFLMRSSELSYLDYCFSIPVLCLRLWVSPRNCWTMPERI